MDTNNWRPTQGVTDTEASDWRTQLGPDFRQNIVKVIMDTLKKYVQSSWKKRLSEMKNVAEKLEEKIYTAATDQKDYLRRISMKLMRVKGAAQSAESNSLQLESACSAEIPPDPASCSIQSNLDKQGQSLIVRSANQSQECQQRISQNVQNKIAFSGIQGSASLPSTRPPITGLTQVPMPNVVCENSNLQNVSSIYSHSVENSVGRGAPFNISDDYQRQSQENQHSPQVVTQQNQKKPQSLLQDLYKQQLPPQLLNQFKQESVANSLIQIHAQQRQLQQHREQDLSQMRLEPSWESVTQTTYFMRPSETRSAPLSDTPQYQQSSVQESKKSVLNIHPQSVLTQPQQPQKASVVHHNLKPVTEQPLLPLQQQQQLRGQQPNNTNIPQNHLIGQENSVPDLLLQQQQRLVCQQNNFQNMLGSQQQIEGLQSNQSSTDQQQLRQRSNVSEPQQCQQLLGTQCGSSSMQHAEAALQQQTQRSASALLPTQGQQSQPQPPEQQLMSQSQPAKSQQLPNSLQQDTLQKLQISATLDPTSEKRYANICDWQEEVSSKVERLKGMYLSELNEMHQKIATKLEQYNSLPQQTKTIPLERLKERMYLLECIIMYLNISKCKITPAYMERLGQVEKKIICILYSNIPRKPVSSLPQGKIPSNVQPMQQSLRPQSQTPQVQPPEDERNALLQSMNLQNSVTTMQQKDGTMSSLSEPANAQRNMINSQQCIRQSDSEQGILAKSLQQVGMGSQQIPLSTTQQPNVETFLSRIGVIVPQPNINPLQSNSDRFQDEHLKQQKEEHNVHTQRLKQQYQQNQMQQQLMQHKRQILQQQPAKLQDYEFSQHQMNDVNDLKVRPGTGVSIQQCQMNEGNNLKVGQGMGKSVLLQRLKSGASFPLYSPKLLQSSSPQIPQHSSPQIDQQNLLKCVIKSGACTQSANSLSTFPSSSPPLALTTKLGDSEKLFSDISSLLSNGNIGNQQTTDALEPATCLVISTPGISTSPLLAESNNLDDIHCSTLKNIFGEPSVDEQPIQGLVKVVNSMSHRALSASVSDMGSVVSMNDGIAGSSPVNGSRAAVGEDLLAITSSRLQARYFTKRDDNFGIRKMKRCKNAVPLDIVSLDDGINEGFNQLTDLEKSEMESTATSCIKRPRFEANYALLEEIREINQRLIDTVVSIGEETYSSAAAALTEGSEGTIVKCSFSAGAVSPNLKLVLASAMMSPILLLRLLVPTNYPYCSPILLDRLPVEISEEHEDLSVKAKSKLNMSLRGLMQPMSLGKIAKIWDHCAREVISEYAQQNGGGTFSSKYGTWEDCLSAA